MLYDDVRTVAYRQKTQGSRKSHDVGVSAKIWLDLIVQGGGKSMFMDQVAEFPEHFVFAWCTKFQLRVSAKITTYAGCLLRYHVPFYCVVVNN